MASIGLDDLEFDLQSVKELGAVDREGTVSATSLKAPEASPSTTLDLCSSP